MNPAVVMMEPHVMARLWSPEIAAHYENLYESKGTTFHKNAKVKAINKGSDGAVESVELEGGVVIPADLVIVGVGAGAVGVPTPEMRRPFLSISKSPSRNAPDSVRSYGLASSVAVGSEMVTFLRLSGIDANPSRFVAPS